MTLSTVAKQNGGSMCGERGRIGLPNKTSVLHLFFFNRHMFNLKEISLVIIVNFCFFPASRDPIPNMCRVGWPSFSSYKRTNSLHCYQREKLLEIERERGHGIRIAGDITASVWFSEKTDSKCIFGLLPINMPCQEAF